MYMGAARPGFGSHSQVGLQAPGLLLAPAGTPSVRQKIRLVSNTAEVFEAVAGFMSGIYHDRPGGSSACPTLSRPGNTAVPARAPRSAGSWPATPSPLE